MDKIEQYRIFIQDLLSNYSQYDPVEVQRIFDTTRDHYQWMNVGWEGLNRVYRCIIHIYIKKGRLLNLPHNLNLEFRINPVNP